MYYIEHYDKSGTYLRSAYQDAELAYETYYRYKANQEAADVWPEGHGLRLIHEILTRTIIDG